MTAREAALKALYETDTEGRYTNAALNAALAAQDFSREDRAFITELVYGVVSERIAIDSIIAKFSKVKIKKMTPWVLNILRLGIYQLCYTDKIPQSAACNESVKLANRYSHKAGAGFVNGVLRSIARSGKIDFPETGDVVKDLSVKFSYPEWITRRLTKQYGAEECERLYRENRRPHPVSIRVNTLKTNADELIKILENEGMTCAADKEIENCLTVSGGINIRESRAYAEGLYSLQNISSQLAVRVLDPQSGERIIDMCAAPGGKSCAAAELMKNRGEILAFDIHEHKVRLIENSAKRLGIDIIKAETADSAIGNPKLYESADRVLADVPCSGLGVIHKKPDIKFSRSESDIEELSKLQYEILENASEYVKCGGVLVYSTCTILHEENGAVTDRFFKAHGEFSKEYERQILTGENGESGFYICKAVKKSRKDF